jgi:putative N6-adenine-specific DNA methylase
MAYYWIGEGRVKVATYSAARMGSILGPLLAAFAPDRHTETVRSAEFALAVCALGLEKVCQREVERIGLEVVGREPGRVRFRVGTPERAAASIMRANLCLRAAERILIEAGRFRALDFDQLFETVRALPWELYFRREDKLVIERVRVKSSRLASQTAVQSVVHKAIYERLCAVYKIVRMPETGRERGLRVYLDSDDCLLGLDSSGEALHRRGYRLAASQAPLKETIAAGIILLSGWSRRLPLLDPFCGSGTIAIEAALYAMDRAPGLGRSFALEDMPFATEDARGGPRSARPTRGPGSANGAEPGAPQSGALADEVEAARSRVRADAEFRIVGTDADARVVEAAKANAAKAGLKGLRAGSLEFRRAVAEEAVPEYEIGSLLCNPPYGERLGTVAEAESLYRSLGEAAPRFSGWGLGFVTNRPDFGDFFGRQAPTAHKIVNGTEEQWFHWYPPAEELRRPSRR